MRIPTFTYDKYANDWLGGFPDKTPNTGRAKKDNSDRWYICIKDIQPSPYAFQIKPSSGPFPDWRLSRFRVGDMAYISSPTTGPKGMPGVGYCDIYYDDSFHQRRISAMQNYDRRIEELSRLDCVILGIDPDHRNRSKFLEREPGDIYGTCSAPGDYGIHESQIPEFFKPWNNQ